MPRRWPRQSSAGRRAGRRRAAPAPRRRRSGRRGRTRSSGAGREHALGPLARRAHDLGREVGDRRRHLDPLPGREPPASRRSARRGASRRRSSPVAQYMVRKSQSSSLENRRSTSPPQSRPAPVLLDQPGGEPRRRVVERRRERVGRRRLEQEVEPSPRRQRWAALRVGLLGLAQRRVGQVAGHRQHPGTALTCRPATALRGVEGHPGADDRAPVAALDRVALVAEAASISARSRVATAGDVERLRRRLGEREPRQRRDDHVVAGATSAATGRGTRSARRASRDQQHRPAARRRPRPARSQIKWSPFQRQFESPFRRARSRASRSCSPSGRRARAGRRSRPPSSHPVPAGCSGQRVRPQALAQVVEDRLADRDLERLGLAHRGRAQSGKSSPRSRRRSRCSATSASGRGCRARSPGITGSRARRRAVGALGRRSRRSRPASPRCRRRGRRSR